jgi:glycosyltransferase involved in cell wall biosynthesis
MNSIDAYGNADYLRGFKKSCVSVVVVVISSQNGNISDTICSVLEQPELLELIVADTQISDVMSPQIQHPQLNDARVRWFRSPGSGKVDLLNQALQSSRGTLLCYLEQDQVLTSGALGRAVLALEQNRHLIMVHDQAHGLGEQEFVPSTVVWRRTMSLLLGPFDPLLGPDFSLAYWKRARQAFPGRIGFLKNLNGRPVPPEADSSLLLPKVSSSDESGLLASTACARPRTKLLPSIRLLGVVHPELNLTDGDDRTTSGRRFDAAILGYWHKYRLLREDRDLANALGKAPEIRNCSMDSMPFSQRPFGVNLIGHAFNRFGIGETVRLAARALSHAGIPYCVIDHAADNGSSATERCLEDKILLPSQQGPYAFNMVWLAAPIHARWICDQGLSQLRNRYTIASWFWETSLWPSPWESVLELADEIWACSNLIRKALEPYQNCSNSRRRIILENMPIAAEVLDLDRYIRPQARLTARNQFGLPADALIFSYGFDLNSSLERKNPMAALKAFQMAFPAEDDVAGKFALMIKTFPPDKPHPAWDEIKQLAAADSRLYVIEADLERDSLLRLYGCCDAFLSLHRSEGFGLGMAEALQMGLDVIATDHGGNTDFCTGPQAHPVRYNLVPIPAGAYPHHQGQVWAEPDLAHAVRLLHAVADKRLGWRQDSMELNTILPYPDSTNYNDYQHRFAAERVGMEYGRRLNLLWSDRKILESHLKWKT